MRPAVAVEHHALVSPPAVSERAPARPSNEVADFLRHVTDYDELMATWFHIAGHASAAADDHLAGSPRPSWHERLWQHPAGPLRAGGVMAAEAVAQLTAETLATIDELMTEGRALEVEVTDYAERVQEVTANLVALDQAYPDRDIDALRQ